MHAQGPTSSHFDFSCHCVLLSFQLQDRNQPEVTDKYFHDVPFDACFASEQPDFYLISNMPGVDGFIMKVDALYKVWEIELHANTVSLIKFQMLIRHQNPAAFLSQGWP